MKYVGHRGWPEYYPENTVLSFVKAIEAGAHGIECDVQFDKHGQPYLLHDVSLKRTAGVDVNISECDETQLKKISVHNPSHFSNKYAPLPIEKLDDMVALIQSHPNIIFFIEIKEDALSRLGVDVCVDNINTILKPAQKNVVLISFSAEVLDYAKRLYEYKIGWVFRIYDVSVMNKANKLTPDYLICNKGILPEEGTLWEGKWAWFVYDIVQKAEAEKFFKRGVTWIESWDIAALSVD